MMTTVRTTSIVSTTTKIAALGDDNIRLGNDEHDGLTGMKPTGSTKIKSSLNF